MVAPSTAWEREIAAEAHRAANRRESASPSRSAAPSARWRRPSARPSATALRRSRPGPSASARRSTGGQPLWASLDFRERGSGLECALESMSRPLPSLSHASGREGIPSRWMTGMRRKRDLRDAQMTDREVGSGAERTPVKLPQVRHWCLRLASLAGHSVVRGKRGFAGDGLPRTFRSAHFNRDIPSGTNAHQRRLVIRCAVPSSRSAAFRHSSSWICIAASLMTKATPDPKRNRSFIFTENFIINPRMSGAWLTATRGPDPLKEIFDQYDGLVRGRLTEAERRCNGAPGKVCRFPQPGPRRRAERPTPCRDFRFRAHTDTVRSAGPAGAGRWGRRARGSRGSR